MIFSWISILNCFYLPIWICRLGGGWGCQLCRFRGGGGGGGGAVSQPHQLLLPLLQLADLPGNLVFGGVGGTEGGLLAMCVHKAGFPHSPGHSLLFLTSARLGLETFDILKCRVCTIMLQENGDRSQSKKMFPITWKTTGPACPSSSSTSLSASTCLSWPNWYRSSAGCRAGLDWLLLPPLARFSYIVSLQNHSQSRRKPIQVLRLIK